MSPRQAFRLISMLMLFASIAAVAVGDRDSGQYYLLLAVLARAIAIDVGTER